MTGSFCLEYAAMNPDEPELGDETLEGAYSAPETLQRALPAGRPGDNAINAPRASGAGIGLAEQPAPPTSRGPLLNRRELADLLGVSLAHVNRLRNQGRLPRALTVGKRTVRWLADEITGWIKEGCPAPGMKKGRARP